MAECRMSLLFYPFNLSCICLRGCIHLIIDTEVQVPPAPMPYHESSNSGRDSVDGVCDNDDDEAAWGAAASQWFQEDVLPLLLLPPPSAAGATSGATTGATTGATAVTVCEEESPHPSANIMFQRDVSFPTDSHPAVDGPRRPPNLVRLEPTAMCVSTAAQGLVPNDCHGRPSGCHPRDKTHRIEVLAQLAPHQHSTPPTPISACGSEATCGHPCLVSVARHGGLFLTSTLDPSSSCPTDDKGEGDCAQPAARCKVRVLTEAALVLPLSELHQSILDRSPERSIN